MSEPISQATRPVPTPIAAPPQSAVALLQAAGDDIPACRALRDRYLDRIEALEPAIQAFVELDLARARAAGIPDGPLRGLPIGVKDTIETADFPTRCGSPIHADRRTGRDAQVIVTLRQAGGAVPGKTVTTEFAFFQPGPTRNPWNTAHTPGGSSSGSAASVAAGMVPFAIGTQTTGSVIRPAAFCGVAGFKPSFGRLSMEGVLTMAHSLDTVGFFAPTVLDVGWFASVMGVVARLSEGTRKPVFGRVSTHLDDQASPAMRQAIEHAFAALEAAGAEVVDLPWPSELVDADLATPLIQNAESARALADLMTGERDRLSPRLLAGLEEGAAVSDEDLEAALGLREPARRAFAQMMARCDALVLPAAPGAAPAGLESTGAPLFNRVWTMIGAPAVNVPGQFDVDGLPLGVQVVGLPDCDSETLAAAAFLERALPARYANK